MPAKSRISILSTILLSFLFLTLQTWAAPTTPDQAVLVVTRWLAMDNKPLGAALGAQVKEVKPFKDELGESLYYVVYLNPRGFVIVPGDDLVEPIIAFVPRGKYDPSPKNPLGTLVSRDMAGRVKKARELEQQVHIQGLQLEATSPWVVAQRKWAWLGYGVPMEVGLESGLENISDIWVPPLVRSKWDQEYVGSEPCYNYFTEWDGVNYPCGCVATAMAQLMFYHVFPIDKVGTKSFSIRVGDKDREAKLRGGDGQGGPYEWDKMVGVPKNDLSDPKRQAIGALTYDAGISTNMDYKVNESGTDTLKAADAFKKVFKYSSAVKGYNNKENIPNIALWAMVNPNLDARHPVLLGIHGGVGGHAIVCDGYGFNANSPYHHLNMGWSGQDNIWYNLPNIDATNHQFNTVYKCVYNIYKNGKGEIVSGRMLEADKKTPIPDVLVTAVVGSKTYEATSDNNGIFAISKIPSATTYNISASKTGYSFPSKQAFTGTSTNNSSTCGNQWLYRFMPNSAPTGDVHGKLHENSSNGPVLSGATVSCGGLTTTTKSDGTYKITGITTGSQTLSFAKSGYDSYSKTITITAGQDLNDGDRWLVKAANTGDVHGKLHQNSANGPALSGAKVSCGGLTTTTRSDGTYKITGISVGQQTLSFSKSGYESYSKTVTITTGQDLNDGDRWLVKLANTGTVHGVLHENSAKGPTLAGAAVSCGGKSGTTGANGSYSLKGIPEGSQTLSFSKSGYESYSTNVTIIAGQDLNAGDNYLVKKVSKGITITNPTAGDEWATDETHDIKWTSKGLDNDQVSIAYSLDDGKSWKEIRGATANDGKLSWTLKQYINSTEDYNKARIKVASAKDPKIYAISERFTITGAAKEIKVTNPTKEDIWGADRPHPIRWNSNGLSSKDEVKISYSLNSGQDWTTIEKSIRNDGSCNWDFKDNTAITKDHDDAKIRVASVKHPSVYGKSDTFTILSPNPGPMSITVTSPALGEVWAADVDHIIRWNTTANISSKAEMRIDFSVDDGANWYLLKRVTSNDGKYAWKFKSNDPNIRNSDQARIRVLYRNRPGVFGISERFTIKGEEPPGEVTVAPTSGDWTTSPQYISATCPGSTRIFITITSTIDGSEPPEPSEPSSSNHNAHIDNDPKTLKLEGELGQLKKFKVRFRGAKDYGYGPATGSFSYSIDLRPGQVTVNPTSGTWYSSPQYISATCPGASRIFITITSTIDGSDPPEPSEPSSSNHNAHIDDDPKTLKLEGELGQLKKFKVRFRGAVGYGYGQSTGSFLYAIDLRPGQVTVDPPSGYWNSSPHYVSATCPGASRIFITYTTTLDGSEPPEPSEPSSSNHNAHIDDDPKTFPLEAAIGQYKRYKVRFRGAVGYGYGPATGSYSYIIDMVVPPPPQIIITNPTPGEQWKADKERYIEWIPLNFPPGQHMHVSYSLNDGGHWQTIDANTENDGSKRWDMKNDKNITKGTHTQSRIRIMWSENWGVQTISERFTVKKD